MSTSCDTDIEVGECGVVEEPQQEAKVRPYIFGITFKDGGYSVRHAADADDAIELSRERHPGRAIAKVEMKDKLAGGLTVLGIFGGFLLTMGLIFLDRWAPKGDNARIIDTGFDADPSILVNRFNMEEDVDTFPQLLPRYIEVLDDGVITRGEGVRWEAAVTKLQADKFVMEKIKNNGEEEAPSRRTLPSQE